MIYMHRMACVEDSKCTQHALGCVSMFQSSLAIVMHKHSQRAACRVFLAAQTADRKTGLARRGSRRLVPRGLAQFISCIYIYIYIYYMYVYIYIYIERERERYYTCAYMCICIYTHSICILYAYVCISISLSLYIYVYIYIYIYVYLYIYIYTHVMIILIQVSSPM